jgi:hypothetical protein
MPAPPITALRSADRQAAGSGAGWTDDSKRGARSEDRSTLSQFEDSTPSVAIPERSREDSRDYSRDRSHSRSGYQHIRRRDHGRSHSPTRRREPQATRSRPTRRARLGPTIRRRPTHRHASRTRHHGSRHRGSLRCRADAQPLQVRSCVQQGPSRRLRGARAPRFFHFVVRASLLAARVSRSSGAKRLRPAQPAIAYN